MERYEKLFTNLKKNKEGAFFPFIVLGDPSIKLSIKLIDMLVEGGADALELGIPFSDPVADGIVIQKSNIRAFNAGITVNKCFDIINQLRCKYPHLPIGLLTYSNIVYSNGINAFYNNCANAKIDSVLIPDLPIEEAKPFIQIAIKKNIAPIFICPPNATNNVIYKISSNTHGYTYLVSRPGVTGTEQYSYLPSSYILSKLREYQAPPLIQGFGIYNINQIKKIIKSGIMGVISGSAIIKIIENDHKYPSTMLDKVKKIVSLFKTATYY
ncbi:MAG: tryptophan synthase subunit alpha [Pantoea sp. Brub]|nr:tryptophan synthase subunit alpha [Pantoea sp. Brub]